MKQSTRGVKLRFGLVGAGRISHSYADAFRETANAELVGLMDVDRAAANSLASKTGSTAYRCLDELLENAKLDAVVVATPPAAHVPICLEALNRGVAVLCEKPVSLSESTARQIRNAAKERGVLFTMASKFRYAEDVVNAHKIVASGVLGDLALFENTFMSYVDMRPRWNSKPEISGGGVLIDNGTHSVDIMRHFIGPLDSIHAVEGRNIQNLGVEETVHITGRSSQGTIGRMDLSWSINKQCDDYIAIYGSKGTLRVGWKASLYRETGQSDWVQFGNGYNKVQAFRDQLNNFSAAMQGLEELVINPEDAVASVQVIQAGYESLARGTWIPIPSESPSILAAPCAA